MQLKREVAENPLFNQWYGKKNTIKMEMKKIFAYASFGLYTK